MQIQCVAWAWGASPQAMYCFFATANPLVGSTSHTVINMIKPIKPCTLETFALNLAVLNLYRIVNPLGSLAA